MQPSKNIIDAKKFISKGDDVLKSEHLDDSIEYYTSAIQHDPKSNFAFFKRGIAYLKLKHISKALEDFTLALEIKPDVPQVYLNRAIAFRIKNRFEEAARDFIDYLILTPTITKQTNQIKAWLKKNGFPYEISN